MTSPPAAPPAPASAERWLLPAVLLVALGVRLWRLDFESLWFDEVASLSEAHLPVADILGRFYWPPLYSLILKPFAGSATNEAVLRFPAAVLGVVTVFVFHRAMLRVVSPRIAAGAALLFALSPFHAELSQQVRHYTLGILAMWLCHLAFVRLLDDESSAWRPVLVWGASAAFAYLSMFLALPLLVVQGIYGLVTLRGARRLRLLAVGLALDVLLLPWVLGSLQQGDRVPNQLRYAGGHLEGLLDALAKTFLGYLPVPAWAQVVGLLGIGAVVATGLVRTRPRFPTVTLLSFAGVLGGLALLTAFVSDPYPRYFTLTLPFFFALLARSLAAMPARRAAVAFAALLAISVAQLGYQLGARQHPDWRALAAKLAEPGFPVCTLVFGMPNMERSVLWYLERDHPEVDVSVHWLEGGYSLDEAGARAIQREVDALAAERECLVYVQGFEWFNDPDRMVLQYLMYRYPWSVEMTKFPAAAAFRLTDPADGN